jgi:hypothetical protein
MQRIKLPSGQIVDIDSVNRIAQPHTTEPVGTSCDYVLAGTFTVARGADADALYAAVDALVCNPTRVATWTGVSASAWKPPEGSAYRIVDSTAQLADVLGHVDKVRERLRAGIIGPAAASNELTLILYAAGWDEIEIAPVADSTEAQS